MFLLYSMVLCTRTVFGVMCCFVMYLSVTLALCDVPFLAAPGGFVPKACFPVEGLEVVEGAGVVVQQVPQEGGATAPGCS